MGKGISLKSETKLKIIELLSTSSLRQIAADMELPFSTVQRISAKYKKNHSIEDFRKKNIGGIQKNTINKVRASKKRNLRIYKFIKQSHETRRMTSSQIKNNLNLQISPSGIRKAMNKLGLFSKKPVKKTKLTPFHIQARMTFCKKYQNWSKSDGHKVIFSDEAKIQLINNAYSRVWRDSNEKLHPDCVEETVKFGGGGLMVGGSISSEGVGDIVFIKGHLDASQYKKILVHHLTKKYPRILQHNQIFQQDNDPKHTAGQVKKYLENKNIETFQGPSNSPDLNPIENCGRTLKAEVSKMNPRNTNDLKMDIEVAGREKISIEYCKNLVESMPERISEVIKNKGYGCDY